MTYRRLCNRCGKEIGKGFEGELIHLCDECLKEFDKFMMGKK